LRNDKFDARNTFSAQKPPFRQNQFGGSIGGPIIKDKLFVIANTEVMRTRQSFPVNLLVATPAMLQGDFRCLNQIFDPRTANAQRIKQPFPNNMIPADRISAFAKLYNDFLLTSPVSPRDPASLARGFNLFASQRVVTDVNKWDTRWDYILSEKDKFFARFNYDQTDQTDQNPKRGDPRIYPLYSRNAVVAWSRVFSPAMINELRVGFSRANLRAGGPVPGQNSDWPSFFGIHNLSITPGCAGVPIVSVQELGAWGFQSGS